MGRNAEEEEEVAGLLDDAAVELADGAIAGLVDGAAVELAVEAAAGLLETGLLTGSVPALSLGTEDMMT